MNRGRFIGLVVICFLFVFGVTSAHAIMGVGKCVKACDGDKECIKMCRDEFLPEDEVKELYKEEFRDCHSGCYDLRGKEKKDCLDGCRDDYRQGRDLPRD